ncbi:hypothetical protein H0H93_001614 [Arthromyces matolae]|nr:hypothetical protein H0H93_001614 [Arthromyces matolae]
MSPSFAHSSAYISKRLVSTAVITTDRTEKVPLKARQYQRMRIRDPKAIENLDPSDFMHVYSSAVKSRKPRLADMVVRDVLELYKRNPASQSELLGQIFTKNVMLLPRTTILRVLQHLKATSWSGFDELIYRAGGEIAVRMLRKSDISPLDRPFLRLFYPPLLMQIKSLRCPKGNTNFQPSYLIYASYGAVMKLLSMSFHAQALDIFQALVHAGFIPAEALHSIDTSITDPSLIISLALIRSSLHWHWHGLATSFLLNLISVQPTNQNIIDLNHDTINTLLNTSQPSLKDVVYAGRLIRAMHKRSPVPDSTIRLFYASAVVVNARLEAEKLYWFTRHEKVVATHQYPPPHHNALAWLMTHFASRSRRTYLARDLAKEVVEGKLFIPAAYRAQFIAKTAALGLASQAQVLWERHAVGKEGGVITGNSALMIRMVSLFWNIHKSHLAKARRFRHMRDPPQDKITHYKEAADRAASLVERVRLAFSFHHAPLSEAPHWSLTSLARACFIVGKLSQGYDAFRFLLARKESPDLYDCNVALSAMAQMNPRRAVAMIEKMVELGLQPDDVTFGTALHYAVMQGRRELVDTLISGIRNLDNSLISQKTLANIINASLSRVSKDSQDEVRTTLSNILYLIQSLPNIHMAPQQQTSKALVYAALRARDGLLAYKFWYRYLRMGAEWNDTEHQRLRHAIGQLIQQRSFTLKREREEMLKHLGQKYANWREREKMLGGATT